MNNTCARAHSSYLSKEEAFTLDRILGKVTQKRKPIVYAVADAAKANSILARLVGTLNG